MKRYLFLLHPLKFLYVQSALIMDFARKGRALLRQARFADTVKGSLGEVRIIGKNLHMGEHSYINSGHIATHEDAGVKIGRWCAQCNNIGNHARHASGYWSRRSQTRQKRGCDHRRRSLDWKQHYHNSGGHHWRNERDWRKFGGYGGYSTLHCMRRDSLQIVIQKRGRRNRAT